MVRNENDSVMKKTTQKIVNVLNLIAFSRRTDSYLKKILQTSIY